jgi:alpha-L-fucosidase 2
MLLQSGDDGVDLLPALPAEWSEGSFRGLRARGGLEVDLHWRYGRPTSVTIRGPVGASVALRFPSGAGRVVIPAAGTTTVNLAAALR